MSTKTGLIICVALGLIPAVSAHERMVSHVTRPDQGYVTYIHAGNQSTEAAQISLQPYAADGRLLPAVARTVKARESVVLTAQDLFGDVSVSHFLVRGGDLDIAVSYDNGTGPSTAQPASRERASSWRLTPGNWQREVDSLAIVNTGNHATDIWVSQRGPKGQILATIKIVTGLLPDAKAAFVLGGPAGSHFVAKAGTSFTISADQMLAITALREGSGRDKGPVMRPHATATSKASSSRDDRGVWFIEGGSVYDVYEMQGYNVATDRLWQSFLYRMTARGRLAEIFGPDFVNQDIQVRSTLYSDIELDFYFATLDLESQEIIQGYVDGFNRRIGEINADSSLLPFEFKVLGLFQIEPWTHRDTMAWLALLQRNFSSLGALGFGQVNNLAMLQELIGRHGPLAGSAMFLDARWTNDPQAPTMIPSNTLTKKAQPTTSEKRQSLAKAAEAPDVRALARRKMADFQENERLLKSIGAYTKGGSYAWALSGSKTASGNPIIYSGPQMGFEAPAIVVEGSIVSDTFSVSGMTVPGIPGIIIGRTPHHAWSMQVGHTNTWDFYFESQDSVQLHHVEVIKVAGGEDVSVPVFRTARGPVVSQSPILSWKYSNWGREWDISKGNLALARATSMDEFGEGVANLAVTQHFCYADRDGNIAYWMSGREPIRPRGEYRLPQGSIAPPREWDAAVVHPPTHDRNSTQGFYAGWNNKARADVEDSSATFLYGRYHRAEVVQDFLKKNGNLSFEQVRDFAIDIAATQAFTSGSGSGGGNTWPWVEEAFRAAVAAHGTPARNAAIALFDGWDEHRVTGGFEGWVTSPDVAEPWLLLDVWLSKAMALVFDDEISGYLNNSTKLSMLIRELDHDSAFSIHYRKWISNKSNPGAPQNMDTIIVAALDEALAELGPGPWGLGARGQLTYPHVLGLPIPGTPYGARSTYAHCVEFGPQGPIRIESTFPLGQSGNILMDENGAPVFDPNFFSMKEGYDSFNLRSFPLFDP